MKILQELLGGLTSTEVGGFVWYRGGRRRYSQISGSDRDG